MGKSSLVARTAKRLRENEGIKTAVVDLSKLGSTQDTLTAEQWLPISLKDHLANGKTEQSGGTAAADCCAAFL